MKSAYILSKKNKYGAKGLKVDGVYFASQKEYKRHLELKLLERAGEIINLRRQVKYPFSVLRYPSGTTPYYVADFVYDRVIKVVDGPLSERIVEDVKSPITKSLAIYRMKWALMLYFYNIRVVEV